MKRWWIRERHNPQLGVYFTPMGQMSVTAARRHEDTLYGTNIMHGYLTKGQYDQRLRELKEEGAQVNA